ncbi:transcriptional regulator [Kineococcus sp. G2]|uniref:transcriptional regulator n=1 Tax=Kineococcus sp. G2 TaxID=3127484 RepID=UPI00301CE6BC
MARTTPRATTAPVGEPALDDTFSSTVRLRICAYLSGCDEADFKAVQEFCGLSQPNLSKNLTALAERGYVDIRKVASGRYTKTRLRLTATGQAALQSHVAALQDIVTTARAQQPTS